MHDCRHPQSGALRCTWATCPNKECPSRNFAFWDIDYERDSYWCGTCEILLQQPIFCLPANGKHKGKKR